MLFFGIDTFQMHWLHHRREGQAEMRNILFVEAALGSKNSIDGGEMGRPRRNAAQWLKVAPHSSTFHRSMAALLRKLFPMYLSPLSSGILDMAIVLQLNRTEHPLVTLKAKPFD